MKELDCRSLSCVIAGRLLDAVSIVDAYRLTKGMNDDDVVDWSIGYGNPTALTLRTWCSEQLRSRGLMRRKKR